MNSKELIQLVLDLNIEFYEKTGYEEENPFEYSTDGIEFNIRFSGKEMFNSCIDSIYIEIDDREDDRDITIEEIREIILKRVSESIKLINKFLGE